VETVKRPCPGRLAGQVQGVGRRELHARGQLEAGDPRVELLLSGVELLVLVVKGTEQVEPGSVDFRRACLLGLKVQYRHSLGSKRGPLVKRREPTARPVANAVDGDALGVWKHHIGR